MGTELPIPQFFCSEVSILQVRDDATQLKDVIFHKLGPRGLGFLWCPSSAPLIHLTKSKLKPSLLCDLRWTFLAGQTTSTLLFCCPLRALNFPCAQFSWLCIYPFSATRGQTCRRPIVGFNHFGDVSILRPKEQL